MTKDRILIKIGFFLSSMVVFFLIIMILGTDIPICFAPDAEFIGWKACLSSKGILIPFVCSIALLATGIFALYLRFRKRSGMLGPITITNVKNKNADIMSFVGTYFLPLVSFSLADNYRHIVVLIILFLLIATIYIKADLYYTNPTLLLWGYKVYDVETMVDNKSVHITIITKDDISNNEVKIKYYPIDKNTFFAIKL